MNNRLIITYGGETFLSKPQGHKESLRITSLAGAKKAFGRRNNENILSAKFTDKDGKVHKIKDAIPVKPKEVKQDADKTGSL